MYTIGYMLKYKAKIHSYKPVLIEYYEIIHIYLPHIVCHTNGLINNFPLHNVVVYIESCVHYSITEIILNLPLIAAPCCIALTSGNTQCESYYLKMKLNVRIITTGVNS